MNISDIFADDGLLARRIAGYRARRGQAAMAQVVAEGDGAQILEAGTGIGKTFAYLAPIIHHGLTAVISTGTRALQDQLYLRDIPFMAETLGRDVRVTMLKGRANYLCRRNLQSPTAQLFDDEGGDWARVLAFAEHDEEGDIRGIDNVPSSSPVWQAAVSTRETCDAQGCDHYSKCFLYQARARAREADIVVVNHHLFLADMRLREEDVAELVPSRDVVVFDEAHLLPSLAPSYFGETLSSGKLFRLLAEVDKQATYGEAPENFAPLCRQWRDALGLFMEETDTLSESSLAATAALAVDSWRRAAELLLRSIEQFRDAAIDHAATSEWVASVAARMGAFALQLSRWLNLAESGTLLCHDDKTPPDEAEQSEEEEAPFVCWLRREEKNILLHSAPVSGRDIFRRAWPSFPRVVLTSATLTVGDAFASFQEEMALEEAETHQWASPFNYARRAMLYQPPGLPPPNSADYTAAVIKAAVPLIDANGGRAFMLFSSWRALREGADLLADCLGEEYEIFRQGDASNERLLRRFCAAERAVLAGSLSFWQGVDVKGGALSLVVADKIPFTPPTDPLLQARDEWRKKRGENAFMQNQLPPAAILMKQVAGRLIRDFADWGVFMACDPRLSQKHYGKIILSSLPAMKPTVDETEVCDFLRVMRAKNPTSP